MTACAWLRQYQLASGLLVSGRLCGTGDACQASVSPIDCQSHSWDKSVTEFFSF